MSFFLGEEFNAQVPEATDVEPSGTVGLCRRHVDLLMDALRTVGLGDFLNTEDADAERKYHEMYDSGYMTKENFEPVTYCQMEIIKACLSFSGNLLPFLQTHKIEICPLCLLNDIHARYGGDVEECPPSFDFWIISAANVALLMWMQVSMLGRAQIGFDESDGGDEEAGDDEGAAE